MQQTTSIVRQRGQLTIPDSIRKVSMWIAPGSVVTIRRVNDDEITIRRHIGKLSEDTNWKKMWRNIYLSRSYTSKYKGSLSEFVAEDRVNRG